MAETVTCPFNLRSRKEVTMLPVQLQLSDDTIFMSDLLTSDSSHTGQVSDSESSINDSDCHLPDKKLNSDPIA